MANKVYNDLQDHTGANASNFKLVRDKIHSDSFLPIKKINEQLNTISLSRA